MEKFRTGNGAGWLDLLATRIGRYRDTPVEALESPARLRAWLRLYALDPSGAVNQDDVNQVRTVREALHRSTVATLHDEPPNTGDLRLIKRALSADRPVQVRADRTGLTLTRPATTAEALARLTRDAMQDLSGPRRAQLRPCGDGSCSGIFLDPTGRRRWCTDQTCGNRMRVRAHRSRAKITPA